MAWWFENGPGKKEPKNQEGEERQDKMNSELFAWLIGIGFVAIQTVFIYVLGKALSVLTNRILPEVEE